MTPARVYICDDNPRMRSLIAERLGGRAVVAGSGATAEEAIDAAGEVEPDLVVLDYRTAIAQLGETVGAIKERSPATTVVIHTGVPRALIEEQVREVGAVYSPKNEPEHLVRLVTAADSSARERASRGS